MVDVFTPEKRSQVMRKIRSVDTKPEIMIRRALHHRGYRFRLHDNRLPGKPDIVLKKFSAVIQVRGCFWHGHDCNDGHSPKTHRSYWVPKLAKNKERDSINDKLLEEAGWDVIVVWECMCSTKKGLEDTIHWIDTRLKKA